MNRSQSYTAAAILQLLLSLIAIAVSLPDLARGATAVAQAGDTVPYVGLVISFMIGTLGLVSAYGVWRQQKWGVVLTIVLRTIDGLLALPGMVSPPSQPVQALALLSVLGSIIVIYLLLRPSRRRDESANSL